MKTKAFNILLGLVLFSQCINAQMYFPPNNSNDWETTLPSSLNWCQSEIDSLYAFLNINNTKAFILLKDGKIVLEHYTKGHSASSNWYWASAGKTITAFAVGIAQQEGYLSVTDKTSTYLGQGWTSCTPQQEEKITIWNQLTMTTGLDDNVSNPFCTEDSCLQYLSDAGTRWAYHNAPYTLLRDVIENATGLGLNIYINQKLKNPTGMNGLFVQQGDNSVYFSTARSMARFGLLALNNGNWNGTQVLTDSNYFNSMVNTSQNLNKSYGYLWWLNGKESYMIPQSQMVFQGSKIPNAPDDMYSAMGLNGQFINVIPSKNMVWIRMGEAPDNSLVPYVLNNEIWKRINDLECEALSTKEKSNNSEWKIYPNPVTDYLKVSSGKLHTPFKYSIYNTKGILVKEGVYRKGIDLSQLSNGVYYLSANNKEGNNVIKFIKN
ncbi:serine hydrolase [Salibacter sp.]|uniref:serine hydrolase n=1 Tax=Salibacter sp. TaxID=2010995 RepID=UPI0028706A45|nr:serine hydrolase [Salibacter sp.]MDR9398177.1 serine hydrolase [Salibacter sp.]MDR9487044.1 serine hydrolase [Salibacter sp.]